MGSRKVAPWVTVHLEPLNSSSCVPQSDNAVSRWGAKSALFKIPKSSFIPTSKLRLYTHLSYPFNSPARLRLLSNACLTFSPIPHPFFFFLFFFSSSFFSSSPIAYLPTRVHLPLLLILPPLCLTTLTTITTTYYAASRRPPSLPSISAINHFSFSLSRSPFH